MTPEEIEQLEWFDEGRDWVLRAYLDLDPATSTSRWNTAS